MAASRINLIAEPAYQSINLVWELHGNRAPEKGRLAIQWSNCASKYNRLLSLAKPSNAGSVTVNVSSGGEYCFRARVVRDGRLVARTRAVHVLLPIEDPIIEDPSNPPDVQPTVEPTQPPSGKGWRVTPTTQLPSTISECPLGFEAAALAEINLGRAAALLPPLQFSTDLWVAARMHSSDMALKDELTHQGWDRFFEVTAFNWIAQNIAVSFKDGVSLARAWLASPPHRASILDVRAHYAGIACVVDQRGTIWSTQYLASSAAPQ